MKQPAPEIKPAQPKQPAPEIKSAQPKQPDDALKINRQCLHTQGARQHNLAEQEAPLACSPRLSVQVESLPESFGSIAGAISPSLFVQRWIAQQDPERAAVPLIISRVRWEMHTAGMPRQRAGFARGSISPAHVCGIWSLRSPGSPRGSLALAPALTWLLLIWLHHAIQRSLIDFGIELGFELGFESS